MTTLRVKLDRNGPADGAEFTWTATSFTLTRWSKRASAVNVLLDVAGVIDQHFFASPERERAAVRLRGAIAFDQQDAAARRLKLFDSHFDLMTQVEGKSRVHRMQAALLERCVVWANARAGKAI